jgi:hypothetical protein
MPTARLATLANDFVVRKKRFTKKAVFVVEKRATFRRNRLDKDTRTDRLVVGKATLE